MGRPKGSLNRGGKKVIKMRRKRGRPRNILPAVPKAKDEILPQPPSVIRKSKFIGYCPSCDFMITGTDLESKLVFLCPSCSKRGRTSNLKKEIKREVMSKKEYLESTINADFHGMPSLNDEDHGDLKVAK